MLLVSISIYLGFIYFILFFYIKKKPPALVTGVCKLFVSTVDILNSMKMFHQVSRTALWEDALVPPLAIIYTSSSIDAS